jgi:hypothetical protein
MAEPYVIAAGLGRACESVALLSREALIGVAIARGCRHNAVFVPADHRQLVVNLSKLHTYTSIDKRHTAILHSLAFPFRSGTPLNPR